MDQVFKCHQILHKINATTNPITFSVALKSVLSNPVTRAWFPMRTFHAFNILSKLTISLFTSLKPGFNHRFPGCSTNFIRPDDYLDYGPCNVAIFSRIGRGPFFAILNWNIPCIRSKHRLEMPQVDGCAGKLPIFHWFTKFSRLRNHVTTKKRFSVRNTSAFQGFFV